MNKQIAIVESMINSVAIISAQIKRIPKTDKRMRNIFVKSYNRRPMNKQKRANAIACITIQSAISAAQISTIISTPNEIPKEGSNIH